MDILKTLSDELIGFTGVRTLMEMYHSGDYSRLLTFRGVLSAISPVIPFLLFIEIIRAAVYKRFKIEDYRMPFFTFVTNRLISRFLSIGAVGFCIAVLEPVALFKSDLSWYWLIYGYVVWELAHFVYHYGGHKVRLFWCLHSPHHAPQAMNLSVTYAHFFLEAPYADIIRTSICLMLGVSPPLLFLIMAIDGTWGAFIHVGENLIRDGRLGVLNRIVLTPSHHRVHHARNPLYMDTNFCNLLNIWDKVFKTYQDEKKEVVIEYGITRPVNPKSFVDMYFGEFICLWKDMRKAPGLKNKLLYVIMPPGWSHTGDHKTAAAVKREMALSSGQPAKDAAEGPGVVTAG